jgi:hypothetical protein
VIDGTADYEAAFGKISSSLPLASAVDDFFRNGGRKAVVARAGTGDRSAARSNQLIGNADAKTGLQSLSRVQEPLGLLLVPDAAYLPEPEAAQVTVAAASLAEALRIFHIADIPKAVASNGPAAAVQWSAGLARSRNMAIYYPWLTTATGAGKKKAKSLRPPSAIAGGIYARLDQARGVWKAPAGQEATPTGISGLANKVTSADGATLQAASINPILEFPGKGIMLWGARTFVAEANSDWKYVPVRRLALFLESSIRDGLAWAQFEPSGEALWAQIRLEVSAFLHTAWRAGAFQGVKPDEAYFVLCDATTMAQDDLDSGRLIVMIGIAPVRPAEFIIIRIEQLMKAA